MSKVVALIFTDPQVPVDAYAEVQSLQNRGAIGLMDIAEVEVKDNGKLKFEHGMVLPIMGREQGLFLPAFIGLIFFHSSQQGSHRVQRSLLDISLDSDFIRGLQEEAQPRRSVLFLHLRGESLKLRSEARRLEVSLSLLQEEKLRRLFHGQTLIPPWSHA